MKNWNDWALAYILALWLLILPLYGIKYLLLRFMYVKEARGAAVLFLIALLLAALAAWGMCPYRNGAGIYPIAWCISYPVATLAVPAFSFFVDLKRKEEVGSKVSIMWWCIEIVVVVPLWFVFWHYFQFSGLGWYWI